jgi:hypothetical protein
MPGTLSPVEPSPPVWKPKSARRPEESPPPADSRGRRNPREWFLRQGNGRQKIVVTLVAAFLPSLPFFIVASTEDLGRREPPPAPAVEPAPEEDQPEEVVPLAGESEQAGPQGKRREDPALAVLRKIAARYFRDRSDVAMGRFLSHFDMKVRYVEGIDASRMRVLERGAGWVEIQAPSTPSVLWNQPAEPEVIIHLHLLEHEGALKLENVQVLSSPGGA